MRDSMLFMTNGMPLRQPSEPNGTRDLYEAERLSTGWQVLRRLTPSASQAVIPSIGGISADHEYAFMNVEAGEGSFGKGGDTSYLGNPDGTFEVLGVGSLGEERLAQGRFISKGGAHVIFATGSPSAWCSVEPCLVQKLEPDAPPMGTPAIYDRAADGPTQVISLLPGELTPNAGEAAEYQGVSTSGTVVAFKIGGVLYVRIDNNETKEVTASPSTFAGLSSDGSTLFYVSEDDIYRFDISSGSSKVLTASGDAEVVNVSRDGSHVYFISKTQLDGGSGAAGQPNLYVWSTSDEAARFIATVSSTDLAAAPNDVEHMPALNTWTSWAVSPIAERGPGANSSRSTPNGNVLIFESHAELAGYETDGHLAVYRFNDVTNSLECVSCKSLVEPVTADARLEWVSGKASLENGNAVTVVNNLSEDGRRVLFETPEALVPNDTDGVNDIYEWQLDEGQGRIDLITSGKTVQIPAPEGLTYPDPNSLLGITPSGRDVFFYSNDQLVPAAGTGGAPAIYDARIDGGFLEPVAPTECSSEACRPLTEAPLSLTGPQSALVLGRGNVKPRCKRVHRKASGKANASMKKRCRKSKHRRHHRRRR